jgi:hypothetical protein
MKGSLSNWCQGDDDALAALASQRVDDRGLRRLWSGGSLAYDAAG